MLVQGGFSLITDEMPQLAERDEAAAVRLTGLVETVLGSDPLVAE